MHIAVIADTHSKDIPLNVQDTFKSCDMILHAGDICDEDNLKRFSAMTEFFGVCGNMDNEAVRRALPEKCIVQAGDVRIGMIHGRGSPDKTLSFVRKAFSKEEVDMIIFGHSHQPFNEKIDGVLFFNPGSLTDDFFAPYRSYGVLDIEDKTIKAEIIKVT